MNKHILVPNVKVGTQSRSSLAILCTTHNRIHYMLSHSAFSLEGKCNDEFDKNLYLRFQYNSRQNFPVIRWLSNDFQSPEQGSIYVLNGEMLHCSSALTHWAACERTVLSFQEHSWVWGIFLFGVVVVTIVYLLTICDTFREQTWRYLIPWQTKLLVSSALPVFLSNTFCLIQAIYEWLLILPPSTLKKMALQKKISQHNTQFNLQGSFNSY